MKQIPREIKDKIREWAESFHTGEWFEKMRIEAAEHGYSLGQDEGWVSEPLTVQKMEEFGFKYIDMMFGGPDTRIAYWRRGNVIVNDCVVTVWNSKEAEINIECKTVGQLKAICEMFGEPLNNKP